MKKLRCLTVSLAVMAVLTAGCQDPKPQTDPSPTTEQAIPTSPTLPDPGDEHILLDQGVYVMHIGNFSGLYVEDGSDAEVTDVCAVLVENRSDRTVQLADFQIISGERTYSFRLTTLPPGQRAIVQELERKSYQDDDQTLLRNVETMVMFETEPSLHEDVFDVVGEENSLELRNRTDRDIPGPIYIYYKTRTDDGFVGGITYRLEIPGLKAGERYAAAAKHFWLGSSQVMFIDYVQ